MFIIADVVLHLTCVDSSCSDLLKRWFRHVSRGVTLHPQLLLTVKSFINFQTCYLHKSKFFKTTILKICSYPINWMLNLNLG